MFPINPPIYMSSRATKHQSRKHSTSSPLAQASKRATRKASKRVTKKAPIAPPLLPSSPLFMGSSLPPLAQLDEIEDKDEKDEEDKEDKEEEEEEEIKQEETKDMDKVLPLPAPVEFISC